MDTLKRQMVESKNAQERQSLLSLMVDQERKYEARERYGRCQSFALLAIRAIFNGSASEAGDKVIVECLDEVIRLDPNFADAWGMRGMYREAREREGSIADYTEAIRLDPQPARYHARGVAFELLSIDRKRTDSREASSLHNRALMDAHEAIRLDGQAGNLYQWRGVLNYETGKYSEALSDYTNAIRLNADTYKDDPFPETGTRVLEALYADRGLTYMRLGQYQQAVADFTKRLQLIDRLEDQFNGLPWVQTFGLKWRRPSGLLNRGKAYSLLKRDNEAMRDYRVACALGDPSKPYLPGTGNVESKEACDLLKAAEGVSQR